MKAYIEKVCRTFLPFFDRFGFKKLAWLIYFIQPLVIRQEFIDLIETFADEMFVFINCICIYHAVETKHELLTINSIVIQSK